MSGSNHFYMCHNPPSFGWVPSWMSLFEVVEHGLAQQPIVSSKCTESGGGNDDCSNLLLEDPSLLSRSTRPAVVVTPEASHRKRSGSCDDDDCRPNAAKKALFGHSQKREQESQESLATQDTQQTIRADYTPVLDEAVEHYAEESFYLQCRGTKEMISLYNDNHNMEKDEAAAAVVVSIGRSEDCTIHCSNTIVSRRHAWLRCQQQPQDDDDDSWLLEADQNSVWLRTAESDTWQELPKGNRRHLELGSIFSLALPSAEKCPGDVQFTLLKQNHPYSRRNCLTGTASFDRQYLDLLRRIRAAGVEQRNKKGSNWTLREQYTLTIDLKASEDKENLLPITTLRKMFQGRGAIIEALWYLRGENHIKFLQKHNCKFWDAQAKDDIVGLNYGLLTNWPASEGTSLNQLQQKVIVPLGNGEKSRNMVCSLCNPGEETVQEACSTSIQFAVSAGERLDLTVMQRSSDVILGLPHDVIVWSVIMHLVRRQVWRNSNRKLSAGTISFVIAAGGAHVYEANEQNMNDLLLRKPIPNVQPILKIQSEEELFDLARNYDGSERSSILVQGYHGENVCYHPLVKITQATEKASSAATPSTAP
jgi:thymidylate synthase